MKVSVVVPIWNAGPYLDGCISGLKRQTFKDFEVIFVIDSKTDDESEELIKKSDGLVFRIVYQNDDGRVSSARNIGMAEASGEYTWFLDVDDEPSPLFLEKMIALIEDTHSDYSACNFIYRQQDSELPEVGTCFHTAEYDGLSAIIAVNEGKISPNVWDKLFKTSLIREEGMRFEKGYSEDYHFVTEASLHADRIAYTSEPLYYYNLHENSRSYSKGNDIARKDVEIFEKYRKVVFEEHREIYGEFCRASMVHLIRSLTLADWEVCKELILRESMKDSKKYCNSSGLEFLVFKISPRLYYFIGRRMRKRRYSKSRVFNPQF